MDCREFRRHHVAFVDDFLPGVDLVRMERHRLECAQCARHDTMIRRALLVMRNVPTIQPSAEFSRRLHARIAALNAVGQGQSTGQPGGRPGLGTLAALSTGVVAASLLALVAIGPTLGASRDVILPPVVASLPDEHTPSPIPTPAMLASASTGIAVWPAVMAAEQAPFHFALAELRLASYSAPPRRGR